MLSSRSLPSSEGDLAGCWIGKLGRESWRKSRPAARVEDLE